MIEADPFDLLDELDNLAPPPVKTPEEQFCYMMLAGNKNKLFLMTAWLRQQLNLHWFLVNDNEIAFVKTYRDVKVTKEVKYEDVCKLYIKYYLEATHLTYFQNIRDKSFIKEPCDIDVVISMLIQNQEIKDVLNTR